VREQLRALDPNLAVFNTETMNEHANKSLLIQASEHISA
jgi:hypothetical protein